ncbi:hypothetical protein LJR267_000171 [Paraburkholderia hospita]|uniref:hypothetical protein n=1 Tax=Paraburkholderia hospita TaxID=169430 RepID=UPI003ED125B7
MPLPNYATPTLNELRTFWRRYPVEDVRRLILEVQHLRQTLDEVEYLRSITEKAWKEESQESCVAHLHTAHDFRAYRREALALLGVRFLIF